MTRNLIQQYYGFLLGIAALLGHYLLVLIPYAMIDRIYTAGLYPVLKWILWPFQWLPFPSIYIYILGVLLIIGLGVLRMSKSSESYMRTILKNSVNLIGIFMFLFYVSWAFNYRSLSIEDRLGLVDLEVEMNSFINLYQETTRELIATRKSLETEISSTEIDNSKIESHIDSLQRMWLSELGYPVGIPARVKPIYPGSLLRISTAGFYFPMGGEGYYDGGLHTLTIPFVMAHELAHNYGVTDEGEANFVAFHTCLLSENSFVRYSALLDFWRYLASTYRRIDPDNFDNMRENIPEVIWEDLKAIRLQHEKYPDIFPKLRDNIYNMYLQSQGVKEGMQSYARVIELELAYRKKYPSRK